MSDYLSEIVKIAKAFQELSVSRTFATQWPMQTAVWIRDKKAYRRKPIDTGTWFKPDHVKLGKNAGLIFVCKPDIAANSALLDWDYAELSWRELADGCPDMFAAMCQRIDGMNSEDSSRLDVFRSLNDEIIRVFKENPAMFKAAQEGLVRALEARREWVNGIEQEQEHPAFGMF